MVSGLQERNSILTGVAASQAVSPVGSVDSSYDDALASLFTSIAAGDTETAQTALAAVKQFPAAQSDASSPLGSFLASVSDSLDSGDIADAQSALKTLKTYTVSNANDETSNSESTSLETSYSTTTFGENVFNLSSALGSQNLNDAIDSYNDLTTLVTNQSFLSSSTDLAERLADDAPATTQLLQIGSSLEAGNITSAQMALDGFLASLSAGSLISAKA
jgi:hypothetical protein